MAVTVSNCIGKIALTTFSILNISEHKAHSDKIINFKKHVLLMNLKFKSSYFFLILSLTFSLCNSPQLLSSRITLFKVWL